MIATKSIVVFNAFSQLLFFSTVIICIAFQVKVKQFVEIAKWKFLNYGSRAIVKHVVKIRICSMFFV